MNWYALYVNVRHEKKVMDKLTEKGFESYVPLTKKMQQWSDRKKVVEVPAFTGYVFVKLNSTDLDKPRYVSGVVNYVYFEGKPAVILEKEILALKYFIDKGYEMELMGNKLKEGDKVICGISEFKELRASIEKLLENGYAMLLFEGVRSNIRLKAPVESLKKIT